MNKRRVIFFTIFGVYHLIIFVFTSYIDAQKQDLGVLTSMYGVLHLFKYGAALGLILFATDFIWSWKDKRTFEKSSSEAADEIKNLKAKVYDLQEAKKVESAPAPTTPPDSETGTK